LFLQKFIEDEMNVSFPIFSATFILIIMSLIILQLEAILIDLSDKIPFLRNIFRPEYIPYLITAATMLIGWLLISWIFHACI